MSLQENEHELPSTMPPGPVTQPARILIVDDEAFIREILVRKLRTLGHVCDSADGGPSALKMLAERPYDLLLTDIMMPEMSGVDLIKEATKIRSEVAVILVTSVVDLEVAVDALKLGAYDYITKPFQ